MKREYEDKVVLVTGGGSGLGQALCLTFAAQKAKIAFLDVNLEGIKETESLLEQKGATFLSFSGDVSNLDQCQEIADSIINHWGRIDVLINNAGLTFIKPFLPEDVKQVYRLMDVNFRGSINMWSVCDQYIRKQQGQVIVISSVAGFAPLYGRTAYSASKHALHGFFETLRTEVQGNGVDVLMVCPSFIATKIRENALDNQGFKAGASTGKVASASEIALKIHRAASARRRFLITGKTGILSFWFRKFLPRFYEKKMLQKMRESGMS